jgi:hypothetical protein
MHMTFCTHEFGTHEQADESQWLESVHISFWTQVFFFLQLPIASGYVALITHS